MNDFCTHRSSLDKSKNLIFADEYDLEDLNVQTFNRLKDGEKKNFFLDLTFTIISPVTNVDDPKTKFLFDLPMNQFDWDKLSISNTAYAGKFHHKILIHCI